MMDLRERFDSALLFIYDARIKAKWAMQGAICSIKHPVRPVGGFLYDEHDHAHICFPARLLKSESFEKVCPLRGKVFIDHEDYCMDLCPYFGFVNFRTDGKTGKKKIEFGMDITTCMLFKPHNEYTKPSCDTCVHIGQETIGDVGSCNLCEDFNYYRKAEDCT